jgi:hypothetical protein
MGFAVDFGFAILHGKRSPAGMRLFAQTHIPRSAERFLASGHEISYFAYRLDITGGGVQRGAANSLQPCLLRLFLTIRLEVYATAGLELVAAPLSIHEI